MIPFILGNFNTLGEECELSATDDDGAPTLLLCSFCDLSFCNSTEWLGKAGGEITAAHFVQNEAHEWARPRCWNGALSKARCGVESQPPRLKKTTIRARCGSAKKQQTRR